MHWAPEPRLNSANSGKGSSEDGAGRGVPIIATYEPQPMAFSQNIRGEVRLESGQGQIMGALSAGGGMPGQGLPTIASVSIRGRAVGDKGHIVLPSIEAHFRCTLEPPREGGWPGWST